MAEKVGFVVLARVKACSERAVLGSLLLGFLVRDLFTLHCTQTSKASPCTRTSQFPGSHPGP
ncbi:MAG: hypothetical protein ACT6T3_21460, partial [Agrobacterium sp.]|uniref:hypothetical protein n=1 Tax=Agrobacterium sp. TaxID=361 RepID=UPI004033B9B1